MCYELALVWRFFSHHWTRYVVAWLLALGLAAHLHNVAWHAFDSSGTPTEKVRRDGNSGHISIDFGGQWLMGRMLVLGHGHELYNMRRQYAVIQSAYPYSDEAPAAEKHDADDLFGSLVEHDESSSQRTRTTMQTLAAPLMAGDVFQEIAVVAVCQDQFWTADAIKELGDKHIGGPLYPPIHALVMAPLAQTNNPRGAYRFMQWFVLGMGFFGGLGISVLTRRRVWWPVAATLIMLYPGFKGGHDLGQNPAVTLAIIIWGWALIARGWGTAGGLTWGLLAFKPTWAAAFFLVPLLTRRWRTSAAMLAVGIGLAAVTLPFVGLESWSDWLKVGKAANHIYDVDANWIPLSRDLLGLFRRVLIDTADNIPYAERDRWYAHVIGWSIWLCVLEVAVKLSQLYYRRVTATTGPWAAFVLISAFLLCLHFMYYDELVSAAGVLLLLDPPARLFQPLVLMFRSRFDHDPAIEADPDYFRPEPAATHPELSGYRVHGTAVANSFVMYAFAILLFIQHTLPWSELGATLSMGRWFPETPEISNNEVVVRSGKTVMHKPTLEVPLGAKNPPLDTLFMLFLWVWCGVCVILGKPSGGQVVGKKPAQ